MILFDHWLFMAFLTVVMWSFVNILDVYFSKEVFQSPYDGVMVSGLFQGMFCFLAVFQLVPFHYTGWMPLCMGMLSGIFFQLACLFYFKALFQKADVVLLQILWNLNMAIVPILSVVLLSQHRSIVQVMGSVVVILGSMLFSLGQKQSEPFSWGSLRWILCAVAMVSLSKVFESGVYSNLGTDFWSGYIYFSLGSGGVGLYVILFKKSHLSLFKRYFKSFFFAESLSVIATCASARAILLNGSASTVVLVEGFTPVVTLGLTLIFLCIHHVFKCERGFLKREILELQLSQLILKILATGVMSLGLYFTLI